ncbi:hypothetical protein F5884DRAFT_862388 [Xylogone sp. PMI_703]|nr:hypothetical protein F5884DRAFT_862388 [Xylogone sp. PMI_703]
MPPERSKHPLAILQSMINGILIETGKALRASDKESGKTLSHANARLRSTIPSAIDNFHQALDEIEINIVRAKAVLTRDLDELRAKRRAADNLAAGISEDTAITENATAMEDVRSADAVINDTLLPQEPVAEDSNSGKPQEAEPNTSNTGDVGKETMEQAMTSSSENMQHTQAKHSSAVGLGIDTGEKPSAVEQTNDTNDILNELFEMDANNNNNTGESNLNFDGMDFSLPGTDASHHQTQDQSQLQNHEFDLSTFGDTAQVNNMSLDSTHNETLDMNNHQVPQGTATGGQAENTDKQNLGNNIFDLGENVNGTDSMNIDFDTNMVGGDDSMFDDLFFNTDDNNNAGGGGGNSGEFDDAFFGLDN